MQGGNTYHFTSRREDPVKFHKELTSIFDNHAAEYSAIWAIFSSFADIDYLALDLGFKLAKECMLNCMKSKYYLSIPYEEVLHRFKAANYAIEEEVVKLQDRLMGV